MPGTGDSDYFALELLDGILLKGESSVSTAASSARRKLATAVTGGVPVNLDPYLFTIDVKPVAGATRPGSRP